MEASFLHNSAYIETPDEVFGLIGEHRPYVCYAKSGWEEAFPFAINSSGLQVPVEDDTVLLSFEELQQIAKEKLNAR